MDLLTVSIAIGLLVSLVFTEMFGLAAGGMIVPGYFALYLHHPLNVLVTLLAALATVGVVRLVSRGMIIYGRRRVVVTVIAGFLIGASVRRLATALPIGSPEDTGETLVLFSVIGFIIPGLIALWMDRQGVVETVAPLLTSAVAVRLVLILLGLELFV